MVSQSVETQSSVNGAYARFARVSGPPGPRVCAEYLEDPPKHTYEFKVVLNRRVSIPGMLDPTPQSGLARKHPDRDGGVSPSRLLVSR